MCLGLRASFVGLLLSVAWLPWSSPGSFLEHACGRIWAYIDTSQQCGSVPLALVYPCGAGTPVRLFWEGGDCVIGRLTKTTGNRFLLWRAAVCALGLVCSSRVIAG